MLKPLVARLFPRFILGFKSPGRRSQEEGTSQFSAELEPARFNHFDSNRRTRQERSESPLDPRLEIHGAYREEPVFRHSSLQPTQTTSPDFQSAIAQTTEPNMAGPSVDFSLNHGLHDTPSLGALDSPNQSKFKESFIPLCLLGILFLLRGFAYGLLDSLNEIFRKATEQPLSTSLKLNAVEFCGYVIAPLLIGRPILKRVGFKWTILTGLSVYACGALVFWPSAVLVSLPAVYISNFLVGSGLAILDTSLNLSASVCGPMESTEVRLNVALGVLSVGSVAAYLTTQAGLFLKVEDAAGVIRIQWTYLIAALSSMLLAVIYYFLPIPEPLDREFQDLVTGREGPHSTRVCGLPVVRVTLIIGTVSLFCYMGVESCLRTKFQTFVTANESK